ncbi:hypothetical protein [Marinimicrococcus flavescens]|uniref:Uncharacterized protein n=1 Tax=Marinimicrococcus flavescens TaxID=3031815 RepID=A0AAP3UXH9_9PROT|nr:hypothetical protein [Marinimicrococcus flavescens]
MQDEARGAADDVRREAGKAAETVTAEARRLGAAARDRVEGTAEAQKDRLADRISGVAEHIGKTAEDLRGQEAWLADLVDVGARELGGIAESLKSRDMGSILSAVEQFGRRQPALFMGATVALGFALGRAANAATSRSAPETGPHAHEAHPQGGPAAEPYRPRPASPAPTGSLDPARTTGQPGAASTPDGGMTPPRPGGTPSNGRIG